MSDKEKREQDFCRCEYNELNESEPMMKPRKSKRRCQKWVVTFVSMTECVGNLITEHMASGVKLAGQVFRLF